MTKISSQAKQVPIVPNVQSPTLNSPILDKVPLTCAAQYDANTILNQKASINAHLRESVKRALEQKVLLFEYADKLGDGRMNPDLHDDDFKTISGAFTKIWEDWAAEVIDNATAIYQRIGDNEAVFMTLWHPNMYGGDVTHVSAILIGKPDDGAGIDVKVAHHESVPIRASAQYQDGRLPGTLGLRTGSYDTRALFAQVDKLEGGSGNVPPIGRLPVMRSVSLGGLPSVSYKIARNFRAAVKFLEDGEQYAKIHAKKLIYAPFASKHDKLPEASYPLPNGASPHEVNATQINNCFDATLALADVAQVDGHQNVSIRRADVDAQTRMMMKLGLIANTAELQTAVPGGIAGFKKLGTTVALDPHAPDFQTPGTLVKALKNDGITLAEYRKSMMLLHLLPKLAVSNSVLVDKPVSTPSIKSKL